MGKLLLAILCLGAALAVATSVYARGGTYHHPEPYAVHSDEHKTHNWAPVIVYSADHSHYHLTYRQR
jgi:hypothetical protein